MLDRRAFLLAALALAACGPGAPPPLEPLAGPRLADLTLETLGGEREPLAALAGRVVAMNLWATWCAPCREEMPALQRLSDILDPGQFAVLGVAIEDNPVYPREYLREAGVRFARHVDRDRALAHGLLGAVSLPQTFLFARDGLLWHRVEGRRAWDASAMVHWFHRFRDDPRAAGRIV